MDRNLKRCGKFNLLHIDGIVYKGLCNNYQEGGGAEKPEGGALPKIAAKIGGVKVKSFI